MSNQIVGSCQDDICDDFDFSEFDRRVQFAENSLRMEQNRERLDQLFHVGVAGSDD